MARRAGLDPCPALGAAGQRSGPGASTSSAAGGLTASRRPCRGRTWSASTRCATSGPRRRPPTSGHRPAARKGRLRAADLTIGPALPRRTSTHRDEFSTVDHQRSRNRDHFEGGRRCGTWHAAVMSRDDPTLAELLAQEDELRLGRFDNDDAWSLGLSWSRRPGGGGPQSSSTSSAAGQQLFHAALPGTAPDNDSWIRRKGNVVRRFGHSSLYVGRLCRDGGHHHRGEVRRADRRVRRARRGVPAARPRRRPGRGGGGVRAAAARGPRARGLGASLSPRRQT